MYVEGVIATQERAKYWRNTFVVLMYEGAQARQAKVLGMLHCSRLSGVIMPIFEFERLLFVRHAWTVYIDELN